MTSSNVFGTPVTEGSSCLQRARNALYNPNVYGKRDEALKFIRNAKDTYGDGISTLCMFYNATGESLRFTQENSFTGKFETAVPILVQNGQWGAFLHTKTTAGASGSVGLVVYRVKVNATEFAKLAFSWATPAGPHNNKSYCDVFDDLDDTADINTDDIYGKMNEKGALQYSVSKKGMRMTTTTETTKSPVYEAQLTIGAAASSVEH